MQDPVDDLLNFIDRSPTPYHAASEVCSRLDAAGYQRLDESALWSLFPGDRRYVVRGGGSIAAFEVGARAPAESGFRIVGAHTDSPNLRIKPNPDVHAHGMHQLAVEPYGGVLLHTWLDRDLSIAGRVSVRSGKSKGKSGASLETRLVDFARPLLRVPSLAIHLYRELREEGLKLNAQKHLVPLVGLSDESTFEALLRSELGLGVKGGDEILAYDLMAYDVAPSTRSGAKGEFIHAARLDNLASSPAGLSALLEAGERGPADPTRVVVLYDHEEVGSRSRQGAGGTFLEDVLERVAISSGDQATAPAGQELARAVSNSWLISADMAHAVHPNYAERHEPGHRPLIGAGPVIKTNSNQSYATDAESAGFFSSLCAQVGVTPQNFVTRSDLGCGSTIGPISAARVGIRTVDVGNPMLSMHSCREMAGAGDVAPMIAVLAEFFSAA
jgi:aspartyl aminopeptidase